jgi:hypothetical protein
MTRRARKWDTLDGRIDPDEQRALAAVETAAGPPPIEHDLRTPAEVIEAKMPFGDPSDWPAYREAVTRAHSQALKDERARARLQPAQRRSRRRCA